MTKEEKRYLATTIKTEFMYPAFRKHDTFRKYEAFYNMLRECGYSEEAIDNLFDDIATCANAEKRNFEEWSTILDAITGE